MKNSDKLAGLKNELHLAGRNITRLVDFEAFTSLDCLWLNDNQLTSLRGLENNFRIKCLYVHNNKLKRIKGSLEVILFYNIQFKRKSIKKNAFFLIFSYLNFSIL